MAPIIFFCETIPYYLHIKNYTNDYRKNRVKYSNQILAVCNKDSSELIKQNILDIYNLYIDATQNRKKRKEVCFSFKKHLCLDYLGPRENKIISEIKYFSKKSIVFASRVEEQFNEMELSINVQSKNTQNPKKSYF